jgi:DNA-binding MurR/RpiR family transcriptional regulator
MISVRPTRAIAKNGTPGAQASGTALEVRFARTELSRQRRQLIRAILDNPKEAYFLSSRELARRYSVDAATIVRTIQALGYQRFADFAADLREHFVRQITPYTVAKAATQEKRSVVGHVEHGLDRDSENLSVLKSTLDTDRVVALATQIHRSRRILVVGVDLAASLAWFLAYGLMPVGLNAEAPVGSAGNLLHKIDLLTEKDLLIAISFGRCLRETVHAVRRARGVPTFGITDGSTTPIAMQCDAHLLVPISSPSFTGSYVAPMALINAITLACTHLQPKRALAILRRTEKDYRSGERWYQEPLRASDRGRGDVSSRRSNGPRPNGANGRRS